jgi:alcohol dehydrogenase (cytochrome c)
MAEIRVFRKFARFFYLQTVLALVIVCSYLISGRGQEPSAAQPAWRADDWITVNKDYSSQRYVDLDQITPNNVSQLNEVCEINLNEPSWFSSGILKIGRTLYVTTRRMTYAIDGATCKLRWRYVLNDDALKVGNLGNDNNRGVAYLDGALFRGTADGRLISLNAKTGQLLWQVQVGNQDKGESIIAAPVAWEGKVFVGIATADLGVRGRVMSFDAKTGAELWHFYTVPETGPYSGGAFWTSFSLDPTTGEVFAPVSNPFPDWTGDVRPGPNLYTNALLSFNAATGALNWYYQAVPHDIHDWDLGTPAALYSTPDGKNIAAIAGKDGNVYAIDRASHVPLFVTAATTQQNVGPFGMTPVRACPGGIGGAQFNSTAYDPQLDALYVGMNDWCWYFFLHPNPSNPTMIVGDDAPDYSLGTPPRGWITAIDGQTGNVLWKYHAHAQVQAGTVTTKGGVVFGGDTLGNLLAFDASSGAVLKSIDAQGALNNGLISYAINGTQYVAAEVGGLSLNSAGITKPLRVGGPLRVKIFSLNGGGAPTIVTAGRVAPDGATQEQMGYNLYHGLCVGCHGFPASGGFNYPLLLRQSHILTDPGLLKNLFATISPPMPKLYPGVLTDDDIQSLVSFLRTLNLPSQPGYTKPTSGGVDEWPAIYSVLTHPRCINCHTLAPKFLPSTDDRFPRQDDDRHPHFFGVIAGSTNPPYPPPMGDKGPAIEHCSSCHGSQNNAFTGAPGAPGWELAPLTMAWETSSNVAMSGNQLCTSLLDPAKNGERDPAALLHHIETEPLVQWAFMPGVRLDGTPRTPPPLTYSQFVAAFTTWVNKGTPCPTP